MQGSDMRPRLDNSYGKRLIDHRASRIALG
jgi:hypothetical protein